MKLLPLIIATVFFISCTSHKKAIEEFTSLKKENKASVVFNELKTVEVKSALDVLNTRYINDAPEDDSLIKLTNQFVLYNLYEKGYEMIYEGETFLKELENEEHVFYVSMEHLEIKEFKFKEEVKDSIKGTVDYVKLKGVETTLQGIVTISNNGIIDENLKKNVKSQESISESPDGEFKHTKGLKDVVLGNSSGSNKYKANVERLDDGLFEYQCQEVARLLVDKIDGEILSLYKKVLKSKK